MRLLRLAGRFGPFRKPFSVELTKVRPGLVAVTGPNGAGKSMLVGSYPASFLREVPGHGALSDVAMSRDDFVEVDVLTDRVYRIRQTVDAVSGKGEAFIAHLDGDQATPLLTTSKVSHADEWAAAHLPPKEVFFSSLFAPQQSGGFLDLAVGERKAVILRVLGLERYELMAARARTEAGRVKDLLVKQAPLLADAATRGSPLVISKKKDELAIQEDVVRATEEELRKAEERLETRRVEHAAALSAAREGEAAARRHRDAKARLDTAAKDVAVLQEKVAAQEKILADRSRIESAVIDLEHLDEQLKQAREWQAEAAAEEKAAEAEVAAVTREGTQLVDHMARIRSRVAAAKERLRDRDAVNQAVAAVPGLRSDLEACQRADEAAKAEVERLQGLRVGGLGERVECLRIGMGHIADGAENPAGIAKGHLVADDQAARASIEVPEALSKARVELYKAATRVGDARGNLENAERTAARLKDNLSAVVDLKAAEDELTIVEAGHAAGEGRRREVLTKRDAAKAKASDLLMKCGDLTVRRPPLAVLAAQKPGLLAAEAKLEELRPALERARAEEAAAGEALRLAPEPRVGLPVQDVTREERAVAAAKVVLFGVRDILSQRTAELKAAEEAAVRLATLEEERRVLEEELSDWNLGADSLGRKGIQALEIDAAGPELTAIVNDLLREAFGPRYTVTLETTRPRDKDGEPMEVFDVRAMDCVKGWEGPAESLSGGQKTIVGEALRLALTTLAARRTGVRECTLVRDESGAALDQENGPAWIAMLRRAAALVGAVQVLFVSHDPALWALADARIRVTEQGTVEVEG